MINLSSDQRSLVQRILAKHLSGREVRAFGSRVHGEVKPYSDLDLVVMPGSALPLLWLSDLREEFEESDLPFSVDLLVWEELSDGFRQIIEQRFEVIQSSK